MSEMEEISPSRPSNEAAGEPAAPADGVKSRGMVLFLTHPLEALKRLKVGYLGAATAFPALGEGDSPAVPDLPIRESERVRRNP
jgi:hypothetical protein